MLALEHSVSDEVFIQAIEYEMAWLESFMETVDHMDDDIKKLNGKYPIELLPKCTRFFKFTCRDGSSVRKDLVKACVDRRYLNVKVAVIFNTLRNTEHSYLLGIKE
jgi:hypothetical protein